MGLAIAEFVVKGEVDKYLIGSLLLLALGGAAGPFADALLRTYVQSKVKLPPGPEEDDDEPKPKPKPKRR